MSASAAVSTGPAASTAPSGLDIRALERATVDACAVAEEERVDGWLMRFSSGKAKRARSAQALAAGTMSLDEKLADLVGRYRQAGLPALVRLTPFSAPAGLDDALAARGWRRFDESVVMARRLARGDATAIATAPDLRVVEPSGADYAGWVGHQRGSSAAEIAGHVARLAFSPVRYRALQLVDSAGRTVAGGQVAVDADGHAGLYDVFVPPDHRRAGHARTLCAALVARAAAVGATVAYLQVDLGNAGALALYRGLGFAEAYRYHYREAPAGARASSAP